MKSMPWCAITLICLISLGCQKAQHGTDADQKAKPAAEVPAPDKPILFQPAIFRDGEEPAFQGTGFLVKAPNGRVAGVTSGHFLERNGPPLVRVFWYDVACEDPIASFNRCWGRPGTLDMGNEVVDRTGDYLVMPTDDEVDSEVVLELDDRDRPELHERVWLPNKVSDSPLGYSLFTGDITEVEPTHLTVVLDGSLHLQSQSGSPFISQKTGKVVGTLSSYRRTFGSGTTLLLCPASAIRKVLADDRDFPLLSDVIGMPRKRPARP